MPHLNPTHPALDRLGYGIDMTAITPMDISSVDNAVTGELRLINKSNTIYSVEIDDVIYNVPESVSVTSDVNTTEGLFIHYPDGGQAYNDFSTDNSFSMRYFALSGPSSTAKATQKSFLRDKQYAFFSFAKNRYSVRLQDYADLLNTDGLLSRVKNLPKPFDGKNATTLKRYKDFFGSYGSHIIISANYGARYPLKAWGSNQDANVNKMFTTDVKANFSGIPSGGQFDATVKNQDQYKTFLGYLQKSISVSGGNQKIANKLANNTASYREYEEWTDSTDSTRAFLMSFRVVELWTLMAVEKKEQVIVSYADELSKAFYYIMNYPEVFKTAVTLDIQTDWAEFNLLTPSATIIPDPKNPFPATNMVFSDTRVQWGKEYSHIYKRMTLHFFVVNDGSPIDFSISHGSLVQGGSGRAEVVMEEKNYINNKITDNVWNTVWYYKAPVKSTPEPSRMWRTDSPRTWDDVLHHYLVEIGERCA